MAGAKKFGAFAGVFTPSILTILGVIMYMRMGWVVGNAGLWGSILIVLVAHIISVTTGLSVSSIATDKKVGAGGIYYVLSRSMGLPIGGAIGLTLFVGTALSIALYLVGFAESFNAYLGLEMTINGYRITGSVALLALVLIAMISTSVALKTQFFILAAIIISLVSIFAGSRDFIPEVIPSFGGADSVAMTEVFAIFFPAVTGFTAGVAMSGDLKDPKKAIPVGTIAAVAVGFVVYIGLTFFLAYTIDAETLRSDYNILFKIALFAPAVVAGIWGATLSSALGGILGAPRILQAMSVDTITPAFLGKGKGKSNEPWNALILCALIAEAGILIGELDVIARVVSMFYLTAYGFINLAFFLESWAGSDFVPTFKVSRWVGLVGFVATFMVMFQLDMLAMFIAFLIIAGIYLWLVRKELSLGTGDIWNSVWTSVVKTGLQRMDVSEEHKRNWKPNILLFSGGTHQRPHLLEFADSLTGKSGIATNFDLIETPEAAVLFPKHKQATTDKELQKYGMFGRRQEVKNVYDGVETIASTYGFSGIEPNTILMGWAKNTRNPVFFAQMTQKLIDLDYNVLYLDYDRRFGFRDYGTIDLWWRDISNNAELMLSLTRFILKSNKWRHARLRILLVNNENIEHQLIEVRVRNILEQFRMRADIRIINNAVEKISIYQLMRVHSSEAALVMLGVPDIKAGKEASFVERTNDLVGVIGTTLLVKASSYFDKTDLGLREIKAKPVRATDIPEPESLKIPDDEKLESTIRALDSRLELAADHFAKNVLSPVSGCYLKMIETARVEVEKLFSQIEENPLAENAYPLLSGQVEKLQQISKATREAELDTLYELFNKGLGQLLQERTEILNEAPRAVYLKNEKGANAPQRFRSERKKVQWRKRLEYYLRTQAIRKLKTVLLNNGMRHFTFLYDYSKLVENKLLLMLSHLSQAENETPEAAIAEAKASSLQLLDNLQQEALNFEQFTLNELKSADREWCNQLSREVDASMNGRKAGKRKEKDNQRVYRKLKRSVAAYPLFWHRNQSLLHKTFENELELRKLSLQLDQVSGRIEAAVQLHLFQKLETRLAELQNAVQQTAVLVDAEDWGSIDIGAFRIEGESFLDPEDILPTLSAQAEQLTTSLPGSLEVFSGDSINDLAEHQGEDLRTVELSLDKLANFILQEKYFAPVEKKLVEMGNAVNQVYSRALNIANFLGYSVNTAIEEQDTSVLPDVLNRSSEQLKTLQEELQKLVLSMPKELEAFQQKADGGLDILAIVNSSSQLKQSIRQKERMTFLRERVEKRRRFFKRQWNSILKVFHRYSASWSAAKFEKEYSAFQNPLAQLAEFNTRISPKPEVEEKLPFYYQQLFEGKHLGSGKDLSNRKREESLVREVIAHREAGFYGALLISGEGRSGKSFFAEHVAHSFFEGPVYPIFPPRMTSANPRDLEKAFQQSCRQEGSVKKILEKLPAGAVFLIRDLELWWFRGENGQKAIDALTNLILQFGEKHIFILSCNLFGFQLIRENTELEKALLQTIIMSPMTRREIREAILFRHRMGGMEFVYRGKKEEELSERQLRNLFQKYHRLSGGNIGVALQAWKASIQSMEGHIITIEDPQPAEFPDLKNPEWKLLLYQFVIHRSLSKNQLSQLFRQQNQNWIREQMEDLIRSQLVLEPTKNVFTLNPKSRPYVEGWLKELQILEMKGGTVNG